MKRSLSLRPHACWFLGGRLCSEEAEQKKRSFDSTNSSSLLFPFSTSTAHFFVSQQRFSEWEGEKERENGMKDKGEGVRTGQAGCVVDPLSSAHNVGWQVLGEWTGDRAFLQAIHLVRQRQLSVCRSLSVCVLFGLSCCVCMCVLLVFLFVGWLLFRLLPVLWEDPFDSSNPTGAGNNPFLCFLGLAAAVATTGEQC